MDKEFFASVLPPEAKQASLWLLVVCAVAAIKNGILCEMAG
jgi:hypothetical protein